MATGEMSIRYHGYASKKAANALESSYISKRERYNTIAANINYARYLGATYPCTYLAIQDMSRNSSAVNKKSEHIAEFASVIERFMEQAEETDRAVALLWGKNYGSSLGDVFDIVSSFYKEGFIDTGFVDLFSKILKYPDLLNLDFLPPGSGRILKYLLTGDFDDETTAQTFVLFTTDVLEKYGDLALKGTKAVATGIASGAKSLWHNWEEYANGEIGLDRMLVEYTTEAVFEVAAKGVLSTFFTPVGATVAMWGLDRISESINGKGFAENVGDLAGEVYDLVAPVIGDGLEAAGNVIDDGLNIISDGLDIISDGFYVVSSSVASWWPW